jgi:hypothetical protein
MGTFVISYNSKMYNTSVHVVHTIIEHAMLII